MHANGEGEFHCIPHDDTLTMGKNVRDAVILTVCLSLTALWLSTGRANPDPGQTFPDVEHESWKEECGACHMLYSPGMLPARSWVKMMRELEDHFGDNASLAPETSGDIERFLVANAADGSNASQYLRRIAYTIPRDKAPQRFSETGFFHYIHDEIPKGVWKRESIGSPANCIACHPRGEEGRYPEREIRIPKK
jgi:hypothetical protein